MARILVVYYSDSGNTKIMAEAVAEGAESVAGPEVELKTTLETTVDDLIAAKAIAFGSPNHYSYMSGPLKTLFDKAWPRRRELYGRVYAAFSSGGIDGIKSRESIEFVCNYFKPKKICPGLSIGGTPNEEQKKACRQLGITLAEEIRE